MLNVENLVINRAVRGTLFDKTTGAVKVSIQNISNPKLECSGEQVFVNDELGQKIAAFDRSKDASFSAENALINFGLLAAQLGSEKTVASADSKIVVDAFELITLESTTTCDLAYTPVANSVKYIYSTHTDKSKNQEYAKAVTASATEFSITGSTITLPTGVFAVGDKVAVWYKRETAEATKITNTTSNFAMGGRFVLEVLAADVCDTNTEYYTYLIFDNAKFDNSVSLDFSPETTHGFTINAMQDYCAASNKLFDIVVAN